MVKQMEDRHSIWIRIFHWTNMIAITMLCLTGYYIHAPESFRLFANMDNARMIQPLLLSQARHHQQRIPQNHPVLPVLVVLVELDLLVKIPLQPIEVGKQIKLLLARLRCPR